MGKTISIRVNEEEFEQINTLVESEGYKSKAELIRDLIREEWNEWAKEVIEHAKENPDDYVNVNLDA